MKRAINTILLAVFICLVGNAQYIENSMTVKSMNGKSKSLSSYIDKTEGHVTLFVFWKTCCPTHLSMIDSLLELTGENGFSDDITVVLVSVDDNRSTDRVMPIVKTKGWEADVILDVNMELARAMSVYIHPQWVAVDHTGSHIFRRKIMEGESDTEYYFNELINEIHKK
jgi:hypothetical protein